MVRRIAAAVAAVVLVASFALAQGQPAAKKTAPKGVAVAAGAPDKAMLQTVLDAWASMNTDNVAKYYDQAPTDVFYDVAPVKYVSFKAYAEGAKQMFATTFSAVKFTLNDDATMHAGTPVWTTATVKAAFTDKAGKATNLDCRWTAIWQKKAGNWVIVHDHFSAPLPPPAQ